MLVKKTVEYKIHNIQRHFYCAYNNTSIYIYTFILNVLLEIFGHNSTTNIFETDKQNN